MSGDRGGPRSGARWSAADLRLMARAMALAERGRGRTQPNPIVGTVLARGGRVIATGHHRRAGGPHAEIVALRRAGRRARGATLYVTLEPCCHRGRTGPCADAILRAGVARVVVGCRDDNPLVDGRGIARLRRGGVRVDVGCREAECREQNRAFLRWVRDRRPFVTLKLAATANGVIGHAGAPRGRPVAISSEAARRLGHRLRSEHDAVLVGAGTVAADDPRLTVRLGGRDARPARDPLRVILDGRLRTRPGARIFRSGRGAVLVVTTRGRGARDPRRERRARALRRAGAEVLALPGDRSGRVPLPRILRALADRGVQSLLVEGGARVHGAFVRAGLADAALIVLAPLLAAGGVPMAADPGPWRALRLARVRAREVGGDLVVAARIDAGARRR